MSQEQSRPIELTSYELSNLLQNLDQLQHLEHLGSLAQSLDRLVEAGGLTTQPPASEQSSPPTSEIPTGAENDLIVLPDGRAVPSAVVRALTEYNETVWPGALLPEARAAIAHVVIREIEGNQEPVLRTNYPFCLDPNPGGQSYDSPCVLRSGHHGKHRDNNDGTW